MYRIRDDCHLNHALFLFSNLFLCCFPWNQNGVILPLEYKSSISLYLRLDCLDNDDADRDATRSRGEKSTA